MTDSALHKEAMLEPLNECRRRQWGIFLAVCALVVGVYAWTARTGAMDVLGANGAGDCPYNLQVQGFRDGRLSVKKEVPPGLALLANPYDPVANQVFRKLPYRLHDMSYYKGRLYLYFGPTPALLLFWPFAALTGVYLWQSTAVVIFCAVGFLAGAMVVWGLWRRYFPQVGFEVVIAGVLALGLATGALILMARTEIYEVAISCGTMLTMLTLAALWQAVHQPEKRAGWLAVASLLYGLAVAARPTLLFGAIILLVPVVLAWRERRPIVSLLVAAIGPITLVGLGLMVYNYRRFDNPLEFGLRYQLTSDWKPQSELFSAGNLWINFELYFLEPLHWIPVFPFLYATTRLTFPDGHSPMDHPMGVLTCIPVVWFVLAAPLAWRCLPTEKRHTLWAFVAAVGLFFGPITAALLLYTSANFRYATEFLPALVLLAVIGLLGLESVLAERPRWGRVARWCWCSLLLFSLAANLLVSIVLSMHTDIDAGDVFMEAGRFQEAAACFARAVRTNPNYASAHYGLGVALAQLNREPEAMDQWEATLRLNPDHAAARYNLGLALERTGRIEEAIQQYEEALRLKPDLSEARQNLMRLRAGH